MFSVEKGGDEYGKVNAIFSEAGNWFNETVYGFMGILPASRLNRIEKGHMRHVKIVKVKNVVIESDKDKKLLATRKEL